MRSCSWAKEPIDQRPTIAQPARTNARRANFRVIESGSPEIFSFDRGGSKNTNSFIPGDLEAQEYVVNRFVAKGGKRSFLSRVLGQMTATRLVVDACCAIALSNRDPRA